MKFILRFTLSIADVAITAIAKRGGFSDISEFAGEWYYGIERPYLPQLGGGEFTFQYPNAFSGTLYFNAEGVCDDIINNIVFVDVSLGDIEDGEFDSLTEGLKDGWKRGEDLSTLIKWATSP
jgi:hypothetical protein